MRQRNGYSFEATKICALCKYFHQKPDSEYDNAKTFEEAHSFDGRCTCMPRVELVKRNYGCGQFKDFKEKG